MRKKREKRKWGLASKLVMIAAAAVFVYAVFQIVTIQLEYKRGNDEYSGLENEFVQKDGGPQSSIMQRVEQLGVDTGEVVTDPTINKSGIDVDFDALKQQNAETIAWIHFPNLDISYPVMQAVDNEYYLKHTFKKEGNANGSIFIDALNSSDFSDDNTIVYGHNMKSGAMFGKLKQYKDASFYDENPFFYILRPGHGADRYQVFSYYQTDSLRTYTMAFTDTARKRDFLGDIARASLHSISIDIDVTDRIVTLVTCPEGRETSNTRFIVHAKLSGK